MTVTVADFRAHYPEFGDAVAYPDAGVTYWLGVAGKLLNASRFSDMLDIATELFVAHNLVLERQAQRAAASASKGAPGLNKGAIASEAVGPVSASYDTSSGIEDGAGHWNLTTFGTRFISLVRMFGAGPIQIT